MKQLLLIPLLMFTSCATHAPKKVTALRATPAGRPVSSNGLRIADDLREYRLGRYVDARDPLVMHEGHPLYRVESSARWDLQPHKGVSLPRRDVIPSQTASANDAVVAEVNKERAATRAVTEQTATLNQKLGELGEAVGQTQGIAKQNIELKRDVVALRQQFNALDTQLRDRKPPAPSTSASPEDKW